MLLRPKRHTQTSLVLLLLFLLGSGFLTTSLLSYYACLLYTSRCV